MSTLNIINLTGAVTGRVGESLMAIESVRCVDGQIAAIAHVHGLVLGTTNVHDFVRFKGLKVENWSKRDGRQKKEPIPD